MDLPEDLFGGLQAGINLDWDENHKNRIMLSLADAPVHGNIILF